MKIESLHAAEALLLRYGLALIFLWIGAMKFTAYEAAGIRPLADHSPLMNNAITASYVLLLFGSAPKLSVANRRQDIRNRIVITTLLLD